MFQQKMLQIYTQNSIIVLMLVTTPKEHYFSKGTFTCDQTLSKPSLRFSYILFFFVCSLFPKATF